MVEKKTVKRAAGGRQPAAAAPKTKTRKLPPVDKGGRGKKYLEVVKLVDKSKLYGLDEALDLATKTSPTKFDASVEAHIKLAVDPKQADQNIRGTVLLPAGSGKTKIIAVVAKGDDIKAAKSAGADFAGEADLIEKISGGWLGFDILIATPDVMAELGKLGKTLGTKGLMPNPKSGTVTQDVAKAVQDFKKGKVEFRVDKDGVLHVPFGKASFSPLQLKENFHALLSAIRSAKPASIKGGYIQRISLATTMGPGIKIDLGSI
jgi:large subunit ribosomal protein L1